jgi:uncharacterized protein with GYD domain
MPTYVVLSRYTQEGVNAMKASLERIRANIERGKAAGIDIKAHYLTLGEYDAVTIIEAPDDATMTAAVIGLGQQGFVRTTTMRAFGLDELPGILAKLP